MSTLVENVEKVKSAHAALSASIEAKGVSVPAGTKLTGMPALVDQIETGGGGGEDYGYLTFTAVEATTLTLKQIRNIEPLKLIKSTDAVTWTKWENPSTNGIALNAGESVYIKADEDALWRTAIDTANYNSFQSNGSIKCYGDIRSLVKLVAPSDYSYFMYSLFNGCTSLTTAPELPATTLAIQCYQSMFNGCTSLTQAPELPATTLARSCYSGMLSGCTSLTSAPELPATTLKDGCYVNMFKDCTSLTQAPDLPATTLANSCYQNMFNGCTSLQTAPELPATTLAGNCYQNMFNGCTSLQTAPELPATSMTPYCYSGMLSGCTSLTAAPELPATSMSMNCYSYMFEECKSLKRIKMNASSGNWGSYMFYGCTYLELVDMTGSTRVPTLDNTNNFGFISQSCKIVVPDSLYDTWIAATNWASISFRIMKQSDWNAAHPDDQL